MEIIKATEKNARALAINTGEELLLMVRLFLADEQPAILAKNIIPLSLLKHSKEKIDGQLRIREILDIYFRQKISFVTTEITSSLADENAQLLSIEPKKHLLNLKTTFYSDKNQPLTTGDNYLNDAILKPLLMQAWN